MLKEKECAKATATDRPIKLFDGGGLYLNITPRGNKTWRLAYREGKTQKVPTIGRFPELSPARARVAVEDFKTAGMPLSVSGDTFEAVALRWHRFKSPEWVPEHAERVLSRIRKDVFPVLGAKAVGSITSADVLTVLRNVEARGARDITKRLRQSIESIFVLAIAEGKATSNPAIGLTQVLAKRPPVEQISAPTGAVNVPLSRLLKLPPSRAHCSPVRLWQGGNRR